MLEEKNLEKALDGGWSWVGFKVGYVLGVLYALYDISVGRTPSFRTVGEGISKLLSQLLIGLACVAPGIACIVAGVVFSVAVFLRPVLCFFSRKPAALAALQALDALEEEDGPDEEDEQDEEGPRPGCRAATDAIRPDSATEPGGTGDNITAENPG